jgi:hypothetical protein
MNSIEASEVKQKLITKQAGLFFGKYSAVGGIGVIALTIIIVLWIVGSQFFGK